MKKTLPTKTSPLKTLQTPLNTVEGLKMVVEAFKENHRVTQEERTKRKNIEVQREIAIKTIKAQRDILKEFIENSFKERKENFDELFKALDKSLEVNDHESLSIILGGIVKLAETSPLSQAKKLINDYENPDVDEIVI